MKNPKWVKGGKMDKLKELKEILKATGLSSLFTVSIASSYDQALEEAASCDSCGLGCSTSCFICSACVLWSVAL
jgi:hypothetical protein